MVKNFDIRKNFAALTIAQKTCFLALLCVMSLALIFAMIPLASGSVKKIEKIRVLSNELKMWKGKSRQIESDLKNFSETGRASDAFDRAKICAKIEAAATKTAAAYTMEEAEKTKLEGFSVSRFKVSFNHIRFNRLVKFFEAVCEIGSNVTIPEARINARAHGQLEAYCVVSILSSE
ncbi:MAG: hypothetical protein LBT64_02970 [Puniceicoccales bacterium]|jgi:hypothetical protein|nr:hypothetical protein [Puniceicoccales bacterium]